MYSKNDDFNEFDRLMSKLEKKDYPIPEEFDSRINKKIQELRRNNFSLKYIFAASAAILIVLISSINIFPSLAVYASEIPGIGGIVEWLVIDKGVLLAKDNGYKNLGPIIEEENGYTIRLDNIFFDESRIRLSALLTSNELFDTKEVKIQRPNEKDSSKETNYSISFDDFKGMPCRTYSEGKNILAKNVELEINQKDMLLNFLNTNPSYISITATIYKGKDKTDEINMKIPFRKENILFSKNYPLNDKMVFDSGDVLVKNLNISPTRITLEMESISKDDYYIKGFEKIYLRNDKGKIYTCTGNTTDKDKSNIKQYYFVPSTYFDNLPSNLYLCYEGVKVYTKKGTKIKLNLNDSYPKNIKYSGEDFIIEDVQLINGVLQVKIDFPNNETLKVGSIVLLNGDNKIISDGTASTVNEGRIKQTEYFNNVPSLSEYEIELSEFGFFNSLSGEIKLILKE